MVELGVPKHVEREQILWIVHHTRAHIADVPIAELCIKAQQLQAEQRGVAFWLQVQNAVIRDHSVLYSRRVWRRTSSLSYMSLYTTSGCLKIRTASVHAGFSSTGMMPGPPGKTTPVSVRRQYHMSHAPLTTHL